MFDIEKEIGLLVKSLMVPANMKGYLYLKDAILILFDHEDYASSMRKLVYQTIADKYDTTPGAVERNLRKAINTIYLNNTKEELVKMFGRCYVTEIGVSPATFIPTCAEKIRLETIM